MTLDGRLLTGVSVLAAIVETGGFGRAGELLGITTSGVSRSLSRLEARVGVRLLDRTTRSVSLTEEGRRFYERVKPSMESIEEAASTATASAAVVQGRLRVNMDPLVMRLLANGRIGSILDAHPGLSLELLSREQIGDMVGEGVDVAVRFGEPVGVSLIARKIADLKLITVASPEYLKRTGRPSHPDKLQLHDCIYLRDPITSRPFSWEFHGKGGALTVKTRSRLCVSDASTMLSECLAGTGVAQVFSVVVRDMVQRGDLVELFPDWGEETFPLYALYPSRKNLPMKVRAFVDFIVDTVK
ncbi:LysR family transcriptional regulator [Rothia nasimurium]|uniref:LysR family transcriptional regulator n=1 Tax=Luteibacter anthropi TaxID=564369 RepID=A0A7X5ZIN5_9GAMM|nr:LysR family transcriptional regulator [Luteibacter anthropi]NII06921.1 LysR family transcriptional regulator [Luteibacter anthropi]